MGPAAKFVDHMSVLHEYTDPNAISPRWTLPTPLLTNKFNVLKNIVSVFFLESTRAMTKSPVCCCLNLEIIRSPLRRIYDLPESLWDLYCGFENFLIQITFCRFFSTVFFIKKAIMRASQGQKTRFRGLQAKWKPFLARLFYHFAIDSKRPHEIRWNVFEVYAWVREFLPFHAGSDFKSGSFREKKLENNESFQPKWTIAALSMTSAMFDKLGRTSVTRISVTATRSETLQENAIILPF